MERHFGLQRRIERGVERIVADTIKASIKYPKESAFLIKFAAVSRKAAKKRMALEETGLHVPGFLIASITSSCNLHCAGCYSRCSSATTDAPPVSQLTAEEWRRIFDEAEDLGVSFVLLAGGEPMIRRDVIEIAGKKRNLVFPIFTNGTFLDEAYFRLLDECRNLIPVLSIEGGKEVTDARRGEGIYECVAANMRRFRERGMIFGASVTVTTENVREVASREFVGDLIQKGCKLIVYVEYVPVSEDSRNLAPGEKERTYLESAVTEMRAGSDEIVLLSFPGDELAMGGCMAAGREFFHINSHGGAEPCPFSPYSDVDIRTTSLKDAINSPLFRRLREQGVLSGEHAGGCVLYEKRDQVEALASENGSVPV